MWKMDFQYGKIHLVQLPFDHDHHHRRRRHHFTLSDVKIYSKCEITSPAHVSNQYRVMWYLSNFTPNFNETEMFDVLTAKKRKKEKKSEKNEIMSFKSILFALKAHLCSKYGIL